MKVLIVSANTLAAAPTGPAYISGAALQAGHQVEVFECLFAQDLTGELGACLRRFQPDVIGISIRLVHAYVLDEKAELNTRHLDLRVRVKEVVSCIRKTTQVPVVLGGPGFNYYASDWLDYLDLDYGIRGEADNSFPLYLHRLETGGDLTTIPGCVFRKDGKFEKVPRDLVQNLDESAFPAYHLFDFDRYAQYGISPAILTKRGCAFNCTYCPYRSLEGPRYRTKSPGRIVNEIEYVQRVSPSSKMIMFCENNFNVPKRHAEAICHEIMDRKVDVRWGTGDLRPMGIDAEFCRLVKASGCDYVNLSVESGSEAMLQSMQRGYTREEIRLSFECLGKAGIPFSASLMIGAPGETPQTVFESLALMDTYDIPLGTWITIGICLWTTRQAVVSEARRVGQLVDDRQLFEGINYMSPELPKEFMLDLIQEMKNKKGYSVQVNHPYAGYRTQIDAELKSGARMS